MPCYTDDILDSLLSLQRFTSLVQWRYVDTDYRPLRVSDSPQWMELRDVSEVLYPEDGWLWTAASDGKVTVGWIVREYAFAGPEWSYESDTVPPPKMRLDGLDVSEGNLELVWFDDRRGTIIGRQLIQSSVVTIDLPETEGAGNGFGKSIAFLIQPVGYTPDRRFAELPNELICQIDVHGSPKWHEERPQVVHDQSYTYEARVRLGGGLPNYPQDYYFRWYFESLGWDPDLGQPPKSGGNPDYWSQQTVSLPGGEDFRQIIVEIYKDAAGEELVGRDIIYAAIR